MVTRYGTSFLGSVLNEAEKTVRCFFANVLASDEVRIDVGTEKEAARTLDDSEEVALEVRGRPKWEQKTRAAGALARRGTC